MTDLDPEEIRKIVREELAESPTLKEIARLLRMLPEETSDAIHNDNVRRRQERQEWPCERY